MRIMFYTLEAFVYESICLLRERWGSLEDEFGKSEKEKERIVGKEKGDSYCERDVGGR